MACKNCNDCQDLGCAPLVYPKCILTEVAYPCIGVAAGVTGTVLLAAINTKFCGIAASLSTINSTILTIQSDIVNIVADIVTIEGDITEINECLLDATGGCEIDNLQASITNIEGDITVIEGDITVIENDIVNLGSDISTLQACVLDASGNCFADETWKSIGGGGTFANGQAVPGYTTIMNGIGGPVQVRLTKDGRINIRGVNTIDPVTYPAGFAGSPTAYVLFTLPLGYQPAVDVVLVTGTGDLTLTTPGGVIILGQNGDVILSGYQGLNTFYIPEIQVSTD